MTATAELPHLDAALQADVAALRSHVTETRALYKEVCGLLFFRYGITPTANKLYGLVRKGSMGTPTEVLAQFWQALREKTRVKIDHPDLPEALKQIAAEAVQTIWQSANEAAAAELAALRAETRLQAEDARAERDLAKAARAAAEEETAAVCAALERARLAESARQDELEAEKQAHAASRARHESAQQQIAALERQLLELRTQFSQELEQMREQVRLAQERASASERRALREIDQERGVRQAAEKAAADLRGELAAQQGRAQQAALEAAEDRAALQAERDAAAKEAGAWKQACAEAEAARQALHVELDEARWRAERERAEAVAARRLAAGPRRPPAVKRTKFKPGTII
ncbi:DNA-binding protein [Cupriavidus malaysiensis]|uniref:KfrA protein n=1 Tax=Cupriavidus malaysiensis TaxID=367825 RepID=A0ABN4TVA9_9BURK|nr:DNA-binding protein [Cupriavidus malaysiensis]AOZ11143.1 KfrA protein [Cupriavidus malaysiensis]